MPLWPWLRSLVGRAQKRWALRSLAIGAISTAVDLAVLISLVRFAHLDPVPAAASGVAVGATANFVLNRRLVFPDSQGPWGGQALRYTFATLAAMAVHATVVFFLADEWGLNYVAAKLIADVLVFAVGNLAILRLVVFPKRLSSR